MMEKETSEVEQFYQDVADLLGTHNNYQYNPNTLGGAYRTRWNNRKPGNGRFEGFGLVRYFGPTCIHVSLTNPVTITKICSSREEVMSLLKNIVDTK